MAVALLLLIAVGGAVAQSAMNAATPAHRKTSSAKACSKIAGCRTCSKKGVCTACKTGADLTGGGKCYCPAGSGKYGSAGTTSSLETANSRKVSQAAAAWSTKSTHGRTRAPKRSGGGGGGSSSSACAPCRLGFYSAQTKLVGSARCVACPAGTTSDVHASTGCMVPPGFYYHSDSGAVKPCPSGSYCLGGSHTGGGASAVACPAGALDAQEGASTLYECFVPPGSYWDDASSSIVLCPANSYCPGGPIDWTGRVVTQCPTGSTSPAGSASPSECTVASGYYYDGTSVLICPADFYCSGGPVTDIGRVKAPCPDHTASVAGSADLGDCTLSAGYFCAYNYPVIKCAVSQCPINSYCPGSVSIANKPPFGAKPCPEHSVAPSGSVAIADCKLAPGYYCSGAYTGGVCTAISLCPVDSYCAGGGPITNPAEHGIDFCPLNTVSVAGSDSKADCKLNPGFYCAYDASDVCTVTLCPALSYCPGGASIEDPSTPGGPIPCPSGQTSQAGASACVDICSAGQLYCSGTCVDSSTDINCGRCGNACPAGSTCSAFGANQISTCLCTANALPVSTPQNAALGTTVTSDLHVTLWEFTLPGSYPGPPNPSIMLYFVVPYDQPPARFVVTDGTPCGNVLVDTMFVGQSSTGCIESAPCCIFSEPSCTGVGGLACPTSPYAIPHPGPGGAGAGTIRFGSDTGVIYVLGYGVCSKSTSSFTVVTDE